MPAQPTKSPQLLRLQRQEKSLHVRSIASLALRVSFLASVASSATFQVLWNLYLRYGFDPGKLAQGSILMVAVVALCLAAPRQLGLPFWPMMLVIEGVTLFAFASWPNEQSVVFLLSMLAWLPGILAPQLIIYWMTRDRAGPDQKL